MMEDELPGLLQEMRQRASDAQRALSPTDARNLCFLDTDDKQLAEQIETQMLLQQAQQTPTG